MRIRRYVGNTMQEAVAQVRAELGKDAVILQTRRIARKGFWGFLGRRRVELIVAVDGDWRSGSKPPATSITAWQRSLPTQATPAPAQPVGTPDPAAVQRLKERLIFLGLPLSEAEAMSEAVRQQCDVIFEPGAHQLLTSRARDLLVRLLAERIHTVEPWEVNNGPYFAALVGPTGVGKTTTVAKLAANYVLASSKRVGLIASDTYRIGAVQQLQEYADLIGIPCEVARDEESLLEAAERMRSLDLVLIDTVGRSQRDTDQIEALRRLLRVLPECECHLVLSATTRLPDLEDIIDRFSCLAPATVIVTKMDETTNPVNALNASHLSGRPLSFLTAGQRVPEDIEVADPINLARAIIEELG